MTVKHANQGEGNRDAAQNFNEAQRRFIREGKVKPAANDAAEMTDEEQAEARRAERDGKSRAKEKDPNVVRDYTQPGE